jgi:hypothetical protein
MRSTRPFYFALLVLLLTFSTASIIARAADEEGDEYDVKARVVRISLITGDVKPQAKGQYRLGTRAAQFSVS